MTRSIPMFAVLFGALTGCASHEDSVCESVGECASGGDTNFIASCKTEAKALRDELATFGCETQFDEYYACADSTFQCQGATPQFSCSAGLKELDTCIHTYGRATSCAALARQQQSCTTPPPVPMGMPPLACTLARDCESRCVLDQAADVCAPDLAELDAIRACVAACPPAQ